MDKSPISLNLAFLIITLVSLILSAFFIYQNRRLNQRLEALIKVTQPTPTPSTAPTPQAKPDLAPPDTANWKTYTNEFWGISFKYPNFDDKCCGISGAVTGNPVILITLADSSTVVPNTDAPFDGIALYGIPNNGNLTLDQYVEKKRLSYYLTLNLWLIPGKLIKG